MSNFEFLIPLNKDELLESHAGQYHVEDVVQPRMLLSKLQDAARGYNTDGIDYILDHFDTYFSIIVHGTKLEWNVINKGFDHVLRTVKNLCAHLEPILQEKTIDSDIRVKNLNIVKMVMYLFSHIMKTKDAKLAADNSTKLTLGKKNKKAADDDEFCGWTESDKQSALVTLHLLLQQPLPHLWDPPLAEDNFVSMVAEPCYKALEEQIIKNKSVRETVFQILGVLIKKYNHGTSCLIKLVQVLQMVEHSVSPICAGVVQLTKDFGLGTFGPQMVREIAEALASTEADNCGTEQGAAKNCGSFLLELTKELPKEMANAIATIQPYLESDESYTIRISVLGMMCEVLSVELKGEGLSDAQRIQRDDFLDDLYDHMHDHSAYVRHKVLQFWSRLQRENCVPVTRQRSVLERAAGRLSDRAALVRKAAIQLLKDKREAVERAYREMYLECEAKSERAQAFNVANRLTKLVSQLDRGGALAMHHIVEKWVAKGDVTPALIQVFWEMFLKKINGTTDMDSYAALSLLVMIAKAKPSVALANLEVIQTYGLTADYNSRALSAELLLSLAKKEQRYPADHALLNSLIESLIEVFSKFNKFNSFAANSIDLIYAICDTPDKVCTKLLAEMYRRMEDAVVKENEDEGSFPAELLARFVFVLGQVALQQLIYLDISVYSELRRRNQVREERKVEEKRKKKLGVFATPARRRVDDLRRQTIMNASNASASSRGQRSASVASNKGPSANTTLTEEEGVEGAVADDADAEYVRGVCERDIVGDGTTLGRYIPLIKTLMTHAKASHTLQTGAALTFTRYMLVSSSFCEEGLQLMVTVLKRSKNVSLRKNLIIAFADLTLRFPNLTQPWTHHIYHILSDEELEIRQCAVKMLSFLVLHEMVRVKGQIADMALCCADKDPKIASMTKLFFKQLSQKGNALYNVMPDIISRLSDPDLNVPEDQYRIIMKYITSLIQKDRQMEALVEKLCQRFKFSTEERQWRDLAYCLSLFTYNERSLRKLIENLDNYKDKLHCKAVMECFTILMNNTSKMAKNEIKALVTELGDKIEECFAVRDNNGDEDDPRSGSDSRETRDKDTGTDVQPKATPRRKPARRNKRKSSSSPDENEPPNQDTTTQSIRKSRRKVAQKTKTTNESEDSDDDDFQKKEVFKKPASRKVTRRRI